MMEQKCGSYWISVSKLLPIGNGFIRIREVVICVLERINRGQ